VQPFSLAGQFRISENYRGPHQFLLDETLFIPLKISLKWSLNRYGVYGGIFCFKLPTTCCRQAYWKTELDEAYDRVTISLEAKFLTVSMATFRDNKQALYLIFQYVLATSNSPQSSITIPIQAKLLWTLETAKEAKVDTLIFTAHTHCLKLKRNLLTGKLPDIKAFLKLFHLHWKLFLFVLLLH